jgi:MGT family glycosyltransferase
MRGPLGLAGKARGLRPIHALNAARLTLVATLPELDPATRRSQPANLVYTGPVVTAPSSVDLASREPTILVSLGTYNFPGMTEAMQRILEAVADVPARVLVTTGPVIDPARLTAPANTEIHRYVDHDELMPRATLVIGHGGHATTMRALAHDVPLVVMPMHPMLDQPMVGKAVERAGAGRLVAKDISTSALRRVVTDLLDDGPHRAAVARLGAAIRGMPGAVLGADAVESALDGALRTEPVE